MATVTKKVDRSVESVKRYQYWASSENADDGTPIAANDVFMIEDSLGRPAKYLYIETAIGTDLQIRINSRKLSYTLNDARTDWPIPGYDWDSEVEQFDTTLAAIPIGADEVLELQKVIPISDITIVAFSAGSFEIFVA